MGQHPFEISIPVQAGDIDEQGHVNNVTYLRWVQEVAVAHWRTVAGKQEQDSLLWIVVRHEIDYRKPALADDTIIARTWVGSATRIRFERHTELLRAADRAVLAKARTVWCPVDADTRRPVLVSDSVRKVFSTPRET